MKQIKFLLLLVLITTTSICYAQIGIGTTSPDPSSVLDLESKNKGFLPPRISQGEILSIQNPAEGLVVYNTTSKTLNVYNGIEWKDMIGNTVTIAIGDFYQGGVVFYIDGNGGGLICTPIDLHDLGGNEWYSVTNNTTGAIATAIGFGQSNTTTIINSQGVGDYAASICDNYDDGTYSDWFLPSKDELNEIFLNKDAINATSILFGGNALAENIYWSSSESGFSKAWSQSLFDGFQIKSEKSTPNWIRAVRQF